MANYAVTTYVVEGPVKTVAAALETKIETIDTGKTIRLQVIVPMGNTFAGVLQYDT